MRTTLTLDDRIGKRLRERAHENRQSFKEVVNQALSLGLSAMETPPQANNYRLRPAAMGQPRHGVNLDKARELADAQEDTAIVNKLEMRK